MSNTGDFISRERYEEMFRNALERISGEYLERGELLKVFRKEIGMTDEEIDYFGYDFSDLKTAKGASMVHLHKQDDDCYLYITKSIDMFKMAAVYQYDIKNKFKDLTLEDVSSVFENALITNRLAYSVVSKEIEGYVDVKNVYELDFEKNILSVLSKDDYEWHSFYLCDIGEAIDEATFNDNMSVEDKHSIFIQQLIGREIEEPIDAGESESPLMNM